MSYWTTFARTGNPNTASSGATWPAYTAANDTYLTLAPSAIATTTQISTQHKCTTFWTPRRLNVADKRRNEPYMIYSFNESADYKGRRDCPG